MSAIVIFGAGGRAGRAITAEARERGHHVTAVVRDPGKYGDIAADGVPVVRGDVTDPRGIASAASGHDAAVHAVTPFNGPERGFAGLDPRSSSRPPTLCFTAWPNPPSPGSCSWACSPTSSAPTGGW